MIDLNGKNSECAVGCNDCVPNLFTMENIKYKPWFVYILKCSDTTLYTGITTDIERRLKEHNSSKRGANYTKTRRPCVLFHSDGPMTKSEALKREYAIKQLSKKEKEMINYVRSQKN